MPCGRILTFLPDGMKWLSICVDFKDRQSEVSLEATSPEQEEAESKETRSL